ncbi:MAG: 30S ribosomal protein S9 [Gemmatimonadales bacterium]|uniref:30S ribosomal protein S9 n=1 Tax=Candidatus Palauibacter TaxID=3056650 RepID=UPI00137E5E52|nr:30S ribosomal protein S9 [Candidatus Palauibacter polyketidifaciens]MXX67384.1 30S ribosomal protein S9 [Gemmatimonadales bacterium]MDE2721412.1 30S ribosomal protein S9 [Candidatus Palauibacter polyketidifaciens]MYG19845.1 30S ribosomal protein S9 [Gemmatimonadales bacterium]MYH10050.1 30S ribosomal protein S9 [Gemmatimonadales bacterium]MYL06029.1 30S ribosomal protein S9 [Gemmatimonadales bacterium]
MAETEQVQSVGRRKKSVSRITMKRGVGVVNVNGRPFEEYFTIPRHRSVVAAPLDVTGTRASYDIAVRVRGGGITGQAEATRLGIARALLAMDEDRRRTLRSHGMLTRDPRIVERKKPGRPKARKRFQFSKR